jgi:hypothetical protein
MKGRAALATFTLCALIVQNMRPALADPALQLDPRIVKLIKTGCGDEHVIVKPPPPFQAQTIPARIVLLSFDDQGAPVDQEASPSPSESATASPQPGSEVTPEPSEAPTSAPTATPLPTPLPRPPAGPGQLPPMVNTSSPLPTPPPPPSPTPVPGQTGPVYLVNPTGPPPTIPLAGSSATPVPFPHPTAAGPTPIPTLAPFQMAILADEVHGFNRSHMPGDAIGNVHIFYSEGQMIGDRAHYDGDHTITLTGHTYLINRNRDTILYGDGITFDTNTNKAVMLNGYGESTEGVAKGKIHYKAQYLSTYRTGVSHGERGSFTTCEKPHAGYHVEAKTIDIFPNDKLVARHATVFLGPTAILYLPLLIIPLRDVEDIRKPTSFLPVIGYSQLEGFYVKAQIGFNPSNTYYGYYRIEYYTKEGLRLGYSAYLGTKNYRRFATVDVETIDDKLTGSRQTNANINETENFSSRLKGQFQAQYESDYGAGVVLPPQLELNATLVRSGVGSTETLNFQRTSQGDLSDTFNLGFVDMINISPQLQEALNLTYGQFSSEGSTTTDTLHIQSMTHWTTKAADFVLDYDKTDYSTVSQSYDTIPELQINPHINWHGFRFPFTLQETVGEYTEPQNGFSTYRSETKFDEPIFMKLGASDFHADYNIVQDFYGTGDAKAFATQNAQLTTPLWFHLVNSLTYNEQNPIGPTDVPFQLLDRLSGGSHSAQDTIRIYNSDIYTFSLSGSTNFDEQAQSVQYQLSVKPSPRSYLIFGGSFVPGPGQGFYLTNVQGITPFGKDTTLQFSTNVDWKNKGRLEDKTAYLSRIIDECYRIDLSYNQDLKQINFAIVILAFPNQAIGGAVGGGAGLTSLLPTSFTGGGF